MGLIKRLLVLIPLAVLLNISIQIVLFLWFIRGPRMDLNIQPFLDEHVLPLIVWAENKQGGTDNG
jgi:hypothetical protein